jgi:hypothetical protein
VERGSESLVVYARYNENFVLVVTSGCCIRWDSTGYQGRSPWLVSKARAELGSADSRGRLSPHKSFNFLPYKLKRASIRSCGNEAVCISESYGVTSRP